MMLQYVRDNKRKKVGVLMAMLSKDGNIIIGHSKWNKKIDKEYDLERCRLVAIGRMDKDSSTSPALSIRVPYLKFLDRARRYFKDAEVSAGTVGAVDHMAAKIEASKLANTEAAAAKAMEVSAVARYKSGRVVE